MKLSALLIIMGMLPFSASAYSKRGTLGKTFVHIKKIDRTPNISPRENPDVLVKGIVRDEKGNTLPGVTVKLKGGKSSTSTDQNGFFNISVPDASAVLIFSFVGYNTIENPVQTDNTMSIVLTPKENTLNDVVVVGYGTQKRATVTGSISTVKTEDITVSPSPSTINTLAGRLPGLTSLQNTGQPGGDQATLSIRGFGQAIWIVDGVEQDFNVIDPNEIASISILKDGAASIYGARAGNGVILVTTKRGKEGKPEITLNSSYTLQTNTYFPQPVNSGEYAELVNQQAQDQGQAAIYTQDQINKFHAGTDPNYPNTNWKSVSMRPWAPMTQQNLSIRGGNENIKYFGFFGYLNQDPVWRNNGGGYQRYNVQSNVDAKISNRLSIKFDLSSVNELKSQPALGDGIGGIWGYFWSTLPIYPATLPDPSYNSYANGIGIGSISLISNENISGYNKYNVYNQKGSFQLDYKIPGIEGLTAKGFVDYNKFGFTQKGFTKPYQFYTYNSANQQYTLVGAYGTQAQLEYDVSTSQNLDRQFSLNYDHTFGNHHITALALYEATDYSNNNIEAGRTNFITDQIQELFAGSTQTATANSSTTESGRASYVGRINYSYKEKYLLETILRADASSVFPPNHRWGYFPSVSAAWRIGQENFMKNLTIVDELKLRASYGASGLDNVGNYQYLTDYGFGGYWLFGTTTNQGLQSTGLANPNLSWERVSIYNAAADFSLWKRKLYGTFEVFYRTLSGIPATQILTLPNTFGATLPQINLNSQNNRGFDLTLGTSGHIGELSFDVSGNLSWSRAKWNHYEEPVYTDPDQRRISQLSGQWTDITYGYKSNGIFTSQAEIDALKFQYPGGNAQLKPGDIKYVDVNGDGKLDYRDEVNIGKSTFPEWGTGANINLRYKGFDLEALLQGAFGYYHDVNLETGNITWSQALYDNIWTTQHNVANAGAPRLNGATTNTLQSDFYFKKAGYLRLKTIAFGYTLPSSLLSKINVKSARVYVAGMNLITINPLAKYDIDPEAPYGSNQLYYPQQKTISLGLNVSL